MVGLVVFNCVDRKPSEHGPWGMIFLAHIYKFKAHALWGIGYARVQFRREAERIGFYI